MKKITILFLSLFIGFSSFSQAVNDQAVIPLSVTLNSIMRLNVTSGGNIDFMFSSIALYSTGIATGPRYQTAFSVQSSVDYKVDLATETATLNHDDGTNTLLLSVIDLYLTGGDATTLLVPATAAPLTAAMAGIVTPVGHNAGLSHSFVINWACGQTAGSTIKELNPVPGRYSTNIFLTLAKN